MIFWHLGLYVLHFKGLRYKYGFYCHILCYHLVLSNISKENYCYICITRFVVFVFGTKLKTSFLDEHWCDKSEWETISTLTAVYCLLASHMPLTGYYNGSRSQNIKFRRSTCCSVFLHMAKQMRHFFSVSLQFLYTIQFDMPLLKPHQNLLYWVQLLKDG